VRSRGATSRGQDDSDDGERDDTRAGDRLLMSIAWQARPWLVPSIVLALVQAGAALALPVVLGRALDQVVAAATAAGEHDPQAGRSWLVVAAVLVGLEVAIDCTGQLVAGRGTSSSTGGLRRRLARHVLAAGPSLSQRTGEGDLVTRLGAASTTVGQALAVVSGLAVAALPAVGGVVALALVDPRLAFTFAVGMVAVSGAVRRYLRDARAATAGYLRAQGEIASRLVEALGGARTIAAARTTRREVARVLQPLDGLRQQGALMWRNLARLAVRGEPVLLLTQVLVVAVAGWGVAAGRLTAGDLLAASRYVVLAVGVGGVVDELAALTRARAGAGRVAEVLAHPAMLYGRAPRPAGPGTLKLRGVTAGSPDAPLLRGVDLVVPGGSTVALVGRSGSGKSLLAAVAGRLCDPLDGTVHLDGVRLADLDRAALRGAVAYAFERPVFTSGTIADVISLGLDGAVPPEQMHGALRAACADRFVARLPGGDAAWLADTPLSGGELQRIGLAQAFARAAAGSRVLILDDATASLDTATEAEIARALTSDGDRRTRLVVTHRATTARHADLVAWLDAGRIRAVAPHDHLWSEAEYRAVFLPHRRVMRCVAPPRVVEAGVHGWVEAIDEVDAIRVAGGSEP
jgi:ATP-binding cassette, subfamily B, bacterial RamA/AmfB